jgi:hypothetical protein
MEEPVPAALKNIGASFAGNGAFTCADSKQMALWDKWRVGIISVLTCVDSEQIRLWHKWRVRKGLFQYTTYLRR